MNGIARDHPDMSDCRSIISRVSAFTGWLADNASPERIVLRGVRLSHTFINNILQTFFPGAASNTTFIPISTKTVTIPVS